MPFSRTLVLLFVCMIVISCGDASQKEVSQAEEKLFVDVYVKLVQAAHDHHDDPDGLAAAHQAVFLEMGTDRDRFLSLAHQMEASPERWAVVWEQIVKRLQEEGKKEGG
ncbi:MAG: hypothetical protein AMJ92_00935 [candidate division Zixibacteria bacterium SM23_81]|nr:MAG: hypothetical protein AMJ92_00935 [candidate division Zixibacteria bacterium SM23_81]